jgi:hypothetical protein
LGNSHILIRNTVSLVSMIRMAITIRITFRATMADSYSKHLRGGMRKRLRFEELNVKSFIGERIYSLAEGDLRIG